MKLDQQAILMQPVPKNDKNWILANSKGKLIGHNNKIMNRKKKALVITTIASSKNFIFVFIGKFIMNKIRNYKGN